MTDKTQLEHVIEVIGQQRELLIEGRQLLKDLRHERKEAEKLFAKFKELSEHYVEEKVSEILEPKMNEQLKEMLKTILEAAEMAEDRIDQRFEKLGNILIYGHPQGKIRGASLVRTHIEQGRAPFQAKGLASTGEALAEVKKIEENR